MALYHTLSLASLRWEASNNELKDRGLLADLVLRHRLLPRDPCAIAEDEDNTCRELLRHCL